jgi:hypothetical protein
LPDIEVFNLEYGVPKEIKVYPIPKIAEARILLRKSAYLDVAFVTLSSLIELYRQRGDVLFDKNVRLSLMYNKEARDRLVSPMENTLDQITQGKMSPAIFPFYHVGVTISAASSSAKEEDAFLCLDGRPLGSVVAADTSRIEPPVHPQGWRIFQPTYMDAGHSGTIREATAA